MAHSSCSKSDGAGPASGPKIGRQAAFRLRQIKAGIAGPIVKPAASYLHPSKFVRNLLSLSFILALALLPQNTQAQTSPITASVNSNNVSTDELVVLTVTVVDDSPQQPRPILPRLDGLAVIDLDIATEVSMVAGQIQTEVTYTYLLQPRRTGLLTIPPVTVKIDDQIYKAPPISIRVRQGSAPAPSPGNAATPGNFSPPANLSGQDFFVEANVDILNPYVGQQIIYTFRFYQALQVYRQPQYTGPLFTGFETIGLPVHEYNIEVDGRTYLITEIRTGLFSKTSGKITIGPARLMLPGNIYEEPVELYTEPVEVAVKPVPDTAPPNFSGAVGQYEMKAWFSPQVAVVNQPSTFSVAITGIGNIQNLPEPVWPNLNGWKSYNSLTSLTTEMKEDLMTGTRVYERVVIPDRVGDFTIMAATFVYFDPIAAEYRTITSQPVSIKVIPPPTPDAAALTPAPSPTPIGAMAALNPSATEEQQASPDIWLGLSSSLNLVIPLVILLFLLCGAVPTAVLVGAGGVWLWQKQQLRPQPIPPPAPQPAAAEEPVLRQPVQRTHPVLAAAMKQNEDNNYKAVSQALNTYLAGILERSVNGLTRTELAHHLRQRGLGEVLVQQIGDYLAQSEMGRYGPITDDAGWSLMTATDELLFELDKVFAGEK